MKLINGNCLEEMDKLIAEGVKIDAIITDPPYGVNFKNNIYNDSREYVKEYSIKWLNKMYKLLKEGGHCYIYTGTKSLGLWLHNIEEHSDFNMNNIIHLKAYENGIYLKNNFSFRTEYIIYLSKGKANRLKKVEFQKTSESWFSDKRNKNPKKFTYNYSNLWTDYFVNIKANKKNKHIHPNQKNEKVVEILVKLSTNEGDVILDPFMGSGTTGFVCKNLNRHFIGIELDKEYCKIGKERIIKNTSPKRLI